MTDRSGPPSNSTSGAGSSTARAALGAIAAVLLWSGYYLVTRIGLDLDLTVEDLVAARYLIPGLLLLPLALRLGIGRRGIAGIAWPRALALTASGGLALSWVLTTGLQFAPVSHGAIFTSATVPLLVVFLAWPMLGDRPKPLSLMGVGLIIAGDVLVADASPTIGGDYLFGQAMMLAAGLLWSTYTVLVRRWSIAAMPATIVTSVISAAIFLPYYLLVAERNIAEAPLFEMSLNFIYLGVLVGIGATVFYTGAVRVLGAQRTALSTALVPACTALMAAAILGEDPTWIEFAGIVLVTAGMPFALGWRPRGGR